MSKIRNFVEITPNLPFSEFNFYELYRETFEQSELGRMKKLLPLHEMAESLGLVNKSMVPKRGRKSYFTPEGKVALMFLKMKTQMSFPKLMEELNGNIHYQLFCDILIDPTHPLTNYKLLDAIAAELAGSLKIQELQNLLAEAWKPYMKNLDTMFTDATCYESEMRYPTDQKLLWECVEKGYGLMCEASLKLGIHRPRTKYLDVAKANLTYRKQRKHTKGQTIQIYNYGNCRRDFTYVDDIVEGITRVMAKAPAKKTGEDGLPIPPYKVYNIGGGQPENLLDFVQILQEELLRAGVLPKDYDFEAHKQLVPMQPGDVPVTYADSTALERDFGFTPKITLREGLRKFAEWYKEYYG